MHTRSLVDFTERMKALGYPRLISMENFRTPNFELIADALTWLVQRYDASAELTDDISNEYARVEFLKSVAQIMVVKARVKLNIKRLYKADGYAVKEMLKVCSLLYNAMQTQEQATAGGVEEGKPGSGTTDITLGDKLDELKEAKEMSSQIVDSGAKLYTLLGKVGIVLLLCLSVGWLLACEYMADSVFVCRVAPLFYTFARDSVHHPYSINM